MTEWLNLRGVAHELGVGVPMVYRAINSGALVAYRLGRVYRVKREDLNAYLDAVRVKPGDLEHLMPAPYNGPRHIDLRAVEAS